MSKFKIGDYVIANNKILKVTATDICMATVERSGFKTAFEEKLLKPLTLQEGDYIDTRNLTLEEFCKVRKAFTLKMSSVEYSKEFYMFGSDTNFTQWIDAVEIAHTTKRPKTGRELTFEQVLSTLPDDEDKIFIDAAIHGTGVMKDCAHVPFSEFYKTGRITDWAKPIQTRDGRKLSGGLNILKDGSITYTNGCLDNDEFYDFFGKDRVACIDLSKYDITYKEGEGLD